MSEDKNTSSRLPASPPSLRENSIFKAICFGGIVGYMFSSPAVDFTFKQFSPIQTLFGGLLGLVVCFALPAGFLLAVLDTTRGNRSGWVALIQVPATIVGGSILLFGLLAIPVAIDVAARSGSEWITGEDDNNLLRRVIGTLVGACFGLVILALIKTNELIRAKWRASRLSQ